MVVDMGVKKVYKPGDRKGAGHFKPIDPDETSAEEDESAVNRPALALEPRDQTPAQTDVR